MDGELEGAAAGLAGGQGPGDESQAGAAGSGAGTGTGVNVGGGAEAAGGIAGGGTGANAGGGAGGAGADGVSQGAGGGGGAGSGADAYQAALAERDAKIAALEGRIAEAAQTAKAAKDLAKQIEDLKAASAAERTEFELKLAGARSVAAARALLGEHGGDVAKLKAAEPWLFADGQAPAGATGLEPAGAAKADDVDMRRWREIAGLDAKE